MSAAGKTTLARVLAHRCRHWRGDVVVLDGDEVRTGLSSGLGFSMEGREENIRRIAHTAKLINLSKVPVIVAAISPLISQRTLARTIIGRDHFVEVHVHAPLEVRQSRDPKGLYKKAAENPSEQFKLTGLGGEYEEPLDPFLSICAVGDCEHELRILLDRFPIR